MVAPPVSVFQTNIPEVDSGLDVQRNVRDVLDVSCTAWLLNTGGIVSHYPSTLDHQHPSPWLKDRPSGDLVGDAVEAAHAAGLRYMAGIVTLAMLKKAAGARRPVCPRLPAATGRRAP